VTASVVQWSDFLATNTGVRGSIPALPDFSNSSGSGTGSTQPREQFEELLGRSSSGSRSRKSKLRSEGLVALTALYPLKLAPASLTDGHRSIGIVR
jgi:hypothetical protein